MTDETSTTPVGVDDLRGVTDVFDRATAGDEGLVERSEGETLRLLHAQYGIEAEPKPDPEPDPEPEPEPEPVPVVEETPVEPEPKPEPKTKPKPKRAPRKA